MIKFFKPTPFKLGVIITIITVLVSYKYYNLAGKNLDHHPLLNIIRIAHQKSMDVRMVSLGVKSVSKNVAIVAIDEDSVEKLGRWPWHRDIIAKTLDQLRKYKVSSVGFDIVFAEPEPANDAKLIESVSQFADHTVLGTYYDPSMEFSAYQEPCADMIAQLSPEYPVMGSEEMPLISLDNTGQILQSSIQNFLKAALQKISTSLAQKNPNINPVELRKMVYENQARFCFDFLDTPASKHLVEKNWLIFQSQDEDLQKIDASQWIQQWKTSTLKNPINTARRLWVNTPEISQKSKHFAFFNAFPDSDGYIRRSRLVAKFGDVVVPSLALKTLMVAKNSGAKVTLDLDPNNPSYKMISNLSLTNPETGEDTETIPVDPEGYLPINYAGPQKMFPYLSVSELLSDSDTAVISQRVDGKIQNFTIKKEDFLKDKIIFIGATAVGIYDMRVTPFEENYPGVETHANIVENLLNHQFMKSYYNEPIYMMGFLLAFGLLLSFLIARFGAVSGLLTSFASFGLIYAVDRYLLFSKGWVTMIVFPIMEILLIYVLLTFYKYLTEERKKKELKTTFQKYVSPAIVNEILSHPEKVRLGGRKELMSVMFSDVRGFTTLSEKLDPEALGNFLNRYLTPMTNLIFKNSGTLDKYIGDAIMAFFGAPISSKTHAQQACQTALDMVAELKSLNEIFVKEKLPAIDIGIGINTGHMSVGNMGSEIVRSYTVMGDSVNLASRLEGITKNYGIRIIISETTFESVKEHFTCRELDRVLVKGKLQPVLIYELLAKKSDKLAPHIQEGLAEFAKGYSLYQEKNFGEAIIAFTAGINKMPDDKASQVYIDRCLEYLANPPSENWNGVYEFKTK